MRTKPTKKNRQCRFHSRNWDIMELKPTLGIKLYGKNINARTSCELNDIVTRSNALASSIADENLLSICWESGPFKTSFWLHLYGTLSKIMWSNSLNAKFNNGNNGMVCVGSDSMQLSSCTHFAHFLLTAWIIWNSFESFESFETFETFETLYSLHRCHDSHYVCESS